MGTLANTSQETLNRESSVVQLQDNVLQFCCEIIKKAEISNYYLGRISGLEFNHNIMTHYFSKEFDFANFTQLATQMMTWQFTPSEVYRLSNQEVLTSFFLLEKVLWYYNDHLVNFRYKIKNLYVLLSLLFNSLRDCDLKYLTNRYNNLVQELPIAGAILISEKPHHVLVVKNNFGKTWSYPKGKLIPGELPNDAAVRECLEETGYNIKTSLDPKRVIVKRYHKKMVYFYVIPNVPLDFQFKPENTNEIVDVKWVPIDQNLSHSRDYNIYVNRSYGDLQRYLCPADTYDKEVTLQPSQSLIKYNISDGLVVI